MHEVFKGERWVESGCRDCRRARGFLTNEEKNKILHPLIRIMVYQNHGKICFHGGELKLKGYGSRYERLVERVQGT